MDPNDPLGTERAYQALVGALRKDSIAGSVMQGAKDAWSALPGLAREFGEDPGGTVLGVGTEMARAHFGLPPRTPGVQDQTAADLEFLRQNPEVGAAHGQLGMPITMHASPTKWTGRPRGENVHGNYFGDGPYSVEPAAVADADRMFGGGSVHVWDTPDNAALLDWDQMIDGMLPDARAKLLRAVQDVPEDAFGTAGHVVQHLMETGQGMAPLQAAGYKGITYRGEKGLGGKRSYVTFDPQDVKPLGTFDNVEDWLRSDLYQRLKGQIE